MPNKRKREQPDPAEHRAPLYADFPFEYERQLRSADGTLYAADAADAPEDAVEVFDIVIATDTPVPFPGGLLVLSHEEGACDLTMAQRGLSFLLEHGGENAPFRIDPDLHVGVVRNVRQTKHQTRGQVEFGPGSRAEQTREEFRQDVRPFISAGWLPLANPVLQRAGKNGNPDVYVMPRWRLCEASSVSVPADPNAQRIGYSAWGIEYPGSGHGDVASKEESLMLKKVFDQGGTVIEVEETDPRPALTEMQLRSLGHAAGHGGGGSAADGDRIAARNREIAEIVNLCTTHGLQARAGEFIEANLTPLQVQGKILEIRTTKGDFAAAPAAERLVDLNKREAEEYSLSRAVACGLALRGERGYKFEGLEADVHREIERQAKAFSSDAGAMVTRGGIFIPMRVRDSVRGDDKLAARLGGGLQTRATSTMGPTIAGGGAEIVPNTLLDMIDILRNNSVCSQLGARTLPGMVGTATWPRVKAEPTVRWMGTNPASPAAQSGVSYGWVMSSPKTLIGTTVVPRQLANLVNFDIENDIRQRLGEGHGLAWDLGGIAGPGTDGQPLGIVYNGDVQTLAMGNTIPTYKLLAQAVGMTRKKNFRGQSIAWATTPELAAVLAATPRVSGAGATDFIWQGPIGNGLVAGYRAMDSNQMPISGSDHELVLGAWSNIVFPLWGAMEITVDPVTLADYAQLKITSFQMGDVVNQRPEGFVRCTGARLS